MVTADKTYNIHEAKTHLSQLLGRVAAGERIVIARAGKPIAVLLAVEEAQRPRVLGLHKHEIFISDDFDTPLPEFEDLKE